MCLFQIVIALDNMHKDYPRKSQNKHGGNMDIVRICFGFI